MVCRAAVPLACEPSCLPPDRPTWSRRSLRSALSIVADPRVVGALAHSQVLLLLCVRGCAQGAYYKDIGVPHGDPFRLVCDSSEMRVSSISDRPPIDHPGFCCRLETRRTGPHRYHHIPARPLPCLPFAQEPTVPRTMHEVFNPH